MLFYFLCAAGLDCLKLNSLLMLLFFNVIPIYYACCLMVPRKVRAMSARTVLASVTYKLMMSALLVLGGCHSCSGSVGTNGGALVIRVNGGGNRHLCYTLNGVNVLVVVKVGVCNTLACSTSAGFLPFTTACLIIRGQAFTGVEGVKRNEVLGGMLNCATLGVFAFNVVSAFVVLKVV